MTIWPDSDVAKQGCSWATGMNRVHHIECRQEGDEFGESSRREDFELGSLLGRGSYACVYEARSRHTGQRVALKVQSAAAHSTFRPHFQRDSTRMKKPGTDLQNPQPQVMDKRLIAASPGLAERVRRQAFASCEVFTMIPAVITIL
jgi:hypothetical protein